MITKEQAAEIVKSKNPDREILSDPIEHNGDYIFPTHSKNMDEYEDFAGIWRWVDSRTGQISQKNMFSEMSKDSELASKVSKLID